MKLLETKQTFGSSALILWGGDGNRSATGLKI